MEEVFAQIYEQGLWNPEEGGKGISGWGSTVENCQCYIQFVELFLLTNGIASVVDLGCGDWSFSRYIRWGDRHYLGIDIVKSVVEENQKKFSSPTVSFKQGNALEMEVPSADLLLCKDVLMHLPNRAVDQLLKKLRKFKHCLITNTIAQEVNRDIQVGGVRALDLTEPPFCLEGLKVFTYHTDHDTKQVFYLRN